METIIVEGKTSTEAIEKGLKQLNTTKQNVNIRILKDEEKKSFFNILAPRVVKVEMSLKEQRETKKPLEIAKIKEKREIVLSEEDYKNAEKNVQEFMQEFMDNLKENLDYSIENKENIVQVNIMGEKAGFLIGYRGETLYAFQTILQSIANRGIQNKITLRLDIENYKEKREKTLKDLAIRTAKTVMRTGKSVTLEPMQAYERKIIHSALQENKKICTDSVGEEPRRRIVISLIK